MIRELSEKYRNFTAGNLSKLIGIKSLSLQEAEVQKELMRQMQEAGFDNVRMDGLGNVIGRIGKGKRVLAFDAHMDTVDLGNLADWNFDPLSGEIAGGYVHGRGSVDQKGGAASFVTAGRILKDIAFDRDISIFFVGSVMEEDCDGLCWKYLIEEEGLKPDAVVVTEPTNMNLYRGQRGRMEMQIEFFGRSCHGSAPERGENAIYMASRSALEIEKLNERLEADDFLGKGTITASELISESPSLCAVADYARLHLDRRLTWGETREGALRQVEELLGGMRAEVKVLNYEESSFTGLRYGMEKYYPCWKLPENHKMIKNAALVFESLFNKAPHIGKWTFSTNGVSINGIYGIPVIGFGPGNEIFAHAPNEKVPVDHLVGASAFYAALACSF